MLILAPMPIKQSYQSPLPNLLSLKWTRPSNPLYSTIGLPAAIQETHQETGA